MIATLDNFTEAEKFSNQIHNWLTENCKNYSASVWQVPTKSEKEELYFIQIPPEYEKNMYQTKTELSKVLTVSKCTITEKLPDTFKTLDSQIPVKK